MVTNVPHKPVVFIFGVNLHRLGNINSHDNERFEENYFFLANLLSTRTVLVIVVLKGMREV
jgi:hypothetical protein